MKSATNRRRQSANFGMRAEGTSLSEAHFCPQVEFDSVPKGARSKRVFDVSLILLTLPFWGSVALVCAIWVKAVSRGPLFFRQERVGIGGERFEILKFRSMSAGADTSVQENHVDRVFDEGPMRKLDASDTRLIPGGRLLRASGLDELPQLINVLRGEMSLVGPRPCTPNELDKYKPWMRRRFAVLPGLTGSWQVGGKNNTTFREMVVLDSFYARYHSRWMDLGIILRTPGALLGQLAEIWQSRSRNFKDGHLRPDTSKSHNPQPQTK